MQALEHNIQSLKQRIKSACNLANRDEDSVYLLPVSKTRSIFELQHCIDLGFKQFGENYLNEAKVKIEALPESIEWHFIGPLQSNKSRYIAERFSWLQSLDRVKLVTRLNAQRPAELPPLNVLIQVNISQDPNKSGVELKHITTLAAEVAQAERLSLRGLMTITQQDLTTEQKAAEFQTMQQAFTQLQQLYPSCDTLSMGMSGDLELAIQHGASMIRIGSDFFGPRNN